MASFMKKLKARRGRRDEKILKKRYRKAAKKQQKEAEENKAVGL